MMMYGDDYDDDDDVDDKKKYNVQPELISANYCIKQTTQKRLLWQTICFRDWEYHAQIMAKISYSCAT